MRYADSCPRGVSCCCCGGAVRPRASAAIAKPRLEGDWVRIDPDGVGSFDGLSASIPPAQLLPGVTAGGVARWRMDAVAAGGAASGAAHGPNPKAFRTSSSRSHAAAVAEVAATARCSSTRTRAACTSSSTRTK